MDYKMLTDRARAASRLAIRIGGQKGRIDQALTQRVARVLHKGEAPPDFAHVLDVLTRLVAVEGEELEELGDDRSRQFTDVSFLVHERNSAFDDLYAQVVDVRRDLVRLGGSKQVRRFFDLGERTARNPERLEEEATQIIERLENFAIPARSDISVNREAMIARMRTPRDRLSKALRGLESIRDDEADLIDEKRQSMDRFDDTYVLVYQLVKALCDLAGMKRWRQCLQPPARRADARLGPRSIVNHLRESKWWPWGKRTDDRPKNVA